MTSIVLPTKAERAGLRGWLLLVGFGIFAGFVASSILVLSTYILDNEGFKSFAAEMYETTRSLWPGMQYLWMAYFASFTLAYLYAGYLFIKKKRSFPTVYIWLLVATVSVSVVDWLIASVLFNLYPESVDPSIKSSSLFALTRTDLLFAMIWIPYMMKSKRVKATFIDD
jgi:hypothetical protein